MFGMDDPVRTRRDAEFEEKGYVRSFSSLEGLDAKKCGNGAGERLGGRLRRNPQGSGFEYGTEFLMGHRKRLTRVGSGKLRG